MHLGTWDGPYDIDVYAIHGALVYNELTDKAKVLIFSGGAEASAERKSILWDPTLAPDDPAAWSEQTFTFDANEDPFCAHQCLLADGELLVMGGAIHGGPNAQGIKRCWLFDPKLEAWSDTDSMSYGRWYPTSVLLADGKVFVTSGWDPGYAIVPEIEIYDPKASPGSRWTTHPQSPLTPLSIYPSLHLVPAGAHAGKIFYSGTRWAGGSNYTSPWSPPDTALFDLGTGTWSSVASHVVGNRTEGMAVLLPPAQDARVLVVGGGHTASDASPASAEVIDLTSPSPSWSSTPPMAENRTNGNLVILPTGDVFVSGGHKTAKSTNTTADFTLQAEIYRPGTGGTGTFSPAAALTHPRQYHSIALLLPDGRVVTAGGRNSQSRQTLEVYSPGYMSDPRPTITAAPASICYGETFSITVDDATAITKIALVRPMATTHHTECGQRWIRLDKQPGGTATTINLAAPADANLAPPGYYMMFVVTAGDVPSEAKFVRVQECKTLLKDLKEAKPEIKEVKEKEIKEFKEFKEFKEKEIKEKDKDKELKEFKEKDKELKEFKEKEFKEDKDKELKEFKDKDKDIREDKAFENVAVAPQFRHFIGPELRPQVGQIQQKPQRDERHELAQQLQKRARDAQRQKDDKDTKDTEKPREG